MFARIVCALLSFCARKFPVKSETQEPRKIIAERTYYVKDNSTMRETFIIIYPQNNIYKGINNYVTDDLIIFIRDDNEKTPIIHKK